MPLTALHKASFAYQQSCGIIAAIAWHKHELARLEASLETLSAGGAAECLPAKDADAARKLAIAVEALEFYADPESHKKPRGSSSLVQDDNGDLARDTLAKIEGNGDAE